MPSETPTVISACAAPQSIANIPKESSLSLIGGPPVETS
jgi:hypothetical protein